ncbi:hypothetical protein AB0T83_01390 [Fluviibacterium sp. DFM31]|uniref:Uncharacterized protein n=1 Tax=Meridianimarinicoccus marinus TaxID=3231483 RepID=A0ABV3L1I9_9RHOB
MVMIIPETGENTAGHVRSAARKQLDRATGALDKLVDQLDDGEIGKIGEAGKLLRELKNALQSAIAERERLEKEQREQAGIVHDYALDFDAARLEIGRRLACLGAAGGAGGVSE